MFPISDLCCRFHIGQAVFRKIGNLHLTNDYTDPESEIGQWLKQFFGLPFLPPGDVVDAYVYDLMPIAPSHANVDAFSDYILQTYVAPDSRFPSDMWAAVRTTNGAEAFHRHIKATITMPHPNIYLLTQALLELQEETSLL